MSANQKSSFAFPSPILFFHRRSVLLRYIFSSWHYFKHQKPYDQTALS